MQYINTSITLHFACESWSLNSSDWRRTTNVSLMMTTTRCMTGCESSQLCLLAGCKLRLRRCAEKLPENSTHSAVAQIVHLLVPVAQIVHLLVPFAPLHYPRCRMMTTSWFLSRLLGVFSIMVDAHRRSAGKEQHRLMCNMVSQRQQHHHHHHHHHTVAQFR